MMERDISYRLSRAREPLNKFGNVLPPGRRELREAAVIKLVVPVLE